MSSPSDTDRSFGGALSVRLGLASAWARFKAYPADLAALSILVVATALVTLAVSPGTTPRFVVALPLLFFLPGYAVVALLFPAVGDLSLRETGETTVRFALAFGTSITVLALTVVVVGGVTELGLVALVEALAVATLFVAQIAAIRRIRLPQHRRYRAGVTRNVRGAIDGFVHDRSRVGMISALFLVVGMLVAGGALAFAVAQPPDAHEYTEFYVGTEADDGTVSTSALPETVTVGESVPMVAGITNLEDAPQDYGVVAQLQVLDDGGQVVEREDLASFDASLDAGENWEHDHAIEPSITGEELRVQYLLYRDDVPETPTADSAYRELHVWIDVEDS